MSMRDDLAHCARQAVGVVACGGTLPYAALVVSSAFPSGVLGLVAVKLAEETGRVVAVLEGRPC